MNSFLSPPGSFLLCVTLIGMCFRVGFGFGTFGFDIHHRYSDPVKGILDIDDDKVPEKGSLEYYMSLHQRDRLVHGRKLVGSDDDNQTMPLTFSSGNETYRLNALGYLHYANVSVGTPSLSFLVALDTGSDLFWLPCDCLSCVTGLRLSSGVKNLSIYSPNTSSTSSIVPCSSSLCPLKSKCSPASSNCPYQINYLSNNTSSSGILVQDVLHLISDDEQSKAVNAQITIGCGKIQTGSFLDGAAPNGLFGLGMTNLSVPSILAKEGITSNSFSMCFGPDGVGRIRFGDKGSSEQGETPFNFGQSHPTYNITIMEINVGGNAQNLEFTAVFDSGTSFTYLNDPAYTLMAESFNSRVLENRYQMDSETPFEYCYELRSNQTSFNIPNLNLTMKGGDQFYVTDSIVIVNQSPTIYCLALVRSGDINIIGQNFMTGYRVVFDRERMILGWKESDCYDVNDSETLPISPAKSTAVPPAVAVNPQATSGNNGSSIAGNPPPASNNSPQLEFLLYTVLLILLPLWAIV